MMLAQPIELLAAGRLPQGRFHGSLAGLGAVSLGATAVAELLADPALPRPARVVWGMARSHSQGMNPARTIALKAGLPANTVGLTVNMACGSGLGAVILAAQALALGEPGPILAGGSEAMSDTPHLLTGLRWGLGLGHREAPDVMHQDGLRCPSTGLLMGETVERLVAKLGVARAEADAYALESHARAARARFAPECLPHPALDRDECVRGAGAYPELSSLPPVFQKGGQITAGNASALADGAAALLLAPSGLPGSGRPLARILGWTEVGVEPMDMGWAPVPAVRSLLDQAGLRVRDIDLWELNEAFAAQVLCCARALDLPMDRLNAAGGGISLGHPIGASGARILVTLIHQLRLRGGGLGVATLGIGGGLGQAMLVSVQA
jgi:acetyl-CoA C-acetyltransferase